LGTLENVVARFPGTDSAGALLLCAHYDSVPSSPGAGDNGAAVAALVEVARLLRPRLPLRNDLILLFTDGEEEGLSGARAFSAEHLEASGVAAVFNFDGRGTGGSLLLIETGQHSAHLVKGYAQCAPQPQAYSIAAAIYGLLPNSTDFTAFREASRPGLNFAHINGVEHYHRASDTIDRLDLRTLRLQGETALALALRFGDSRVLRSGAEEAAGYFTLPYVGVVFYPVGWATAMTLLCLLLWALVTAAQFRRQSLTPLGCVRGVALVLGVAVGTGLCVACVARLLPRAAADSPLCLPIQVAAALTVAGLLQRLFARRVTTTERTWAATLIWSAGAVALWRWHPEACYAAALTSGSCLFALLVSTDEDDFPHPSWKAAVLCLSCIPIILILTPLVYLIAVALTARGAGVTVALLIFCQALLAPHLALLSLAGSGNGTGRTRDGRM
jgi:hypothetical protein